MEHVCIVAEIGCNHNGNIDIAKELLIKAKEAGADYAKFQLFNSEKLVCPNAEMAEYQKRSIDDDSQISMLKKLELSESKYLELKDYAEEIGIQVFATPFDIDSVDYLNSIGQYIWKIPSGEITNLPLLEKIAGIECDNKEIILSTGMSTMEEITDAVSVLERSLNTKFTILQCNTQYPTMDDDMNLLVLDTLKKQFPKWHVGLSDHSEDCVAAIAAVGMGAVFVEKHFTLDKNLPGPDHKASITPAELETLCVNIRRVEKMLGNANKKVTDSEFQNKNVARKSIVASRAINKGELFSEENLTCKRPGDGISPMRWYDLIGKESNADYKENEMIKYDGVM